MYEENGGVIRCPLPSVDFLMARCVAMQRRQSTARRRGLSGGLYVFVYGSYRQPAADLRVLLYRGTVERVCWAQVRVRTTGDLVDQTNHGQQGVLTRQRSTNAACRSHRRIIIRGAVSRTESLNLSVLSPRDCQLLVTGSRFSFPHHRSSPLTPSSGGGLGVSANPRFLKSSLAIRFLAVVDRG